MTEQKAISLTRAALGHAGFDATAFAPVPFWNNSSALFASNTMDPCTGYVLWKNTNQVSGLTFDFSVDIRRGNGTAVMTVSRPK